MTSIHNLSSLVVLAEFNGKTMLLTGDARGDYIIDSLKEPKLLTNGKLHVDVLKVPHHGSRRNSAVKFFEMIPARHYVFSAEGTASIRTRRRRPSTTCSRRGRKALTRSG